MTNREIKLSIVLMFAFLIGLVFLCDGHAEGLTSKQLCRYMRYYNMGHDVAIEDHEHYKLWQHSQHKMKETLKEQAYREGYLDEGAYLAMPIMNRIKYNFKYNAWVQELHLKKWR